MVLLAFIVGVYYGFHTGVKNYYHLENVLSSNLDVLRAKDLKGGSEEELKHIYWEHEISIGEAIDSYNWYHSSGNHFFSKVFLSGHLEHLEQSIENLASYRNLNPVETEPESLICKHLEADTAKEYCLKRLEERQNIVRKYAEKS